MILSKLKIERFKKLEKVELEVEDLNVFVGVNGCGKSSILQAIHLACCVLRQVYRVDKSRASTIGIEHLDYLPSNNYKKLGNKKDWGNTESTQSSEIEMTFSKAAATSIATCKLRSARNAGISITGSVPSDLSAILRNKQNFASAYIGGISGIPNQEEKKSQKVVYKACSYGDSNVILRNVLLLLKQRGRDNLSKIESWINEIAGTIKIEVVHDEAKDLVISCAVKIGAETIPLELIGTGFLQLIQIFAYILLFEPRILLIDEPDIHLHPTLQEKLVSVLARVAKERGFRVLLTTHSPFIVRGAPINSIIYWVNDGTIETANRRQVELALGWGAFGKKIIFVTEDSNIQYLKFLVAQWPEIERNIAFIPGSGCKQITTPSQAAEIQVALGGKFKIIVHRDRDSLTDEEVSKIKQTYIDQGVAFWCTDDSDLEGYFTKPEYLAGLLGCTLQTATGYVEDVLAKYSIPIVQQFDSQRRTHNQDYHTGGSPKNEDVWKELQKRPLRGAKGKYVFGQLKNMIPSNAFNEAEILKYKPEPELAVNLKKALEQLLKA